MSYLHVPPYGCADVIAEVFALINAACEVSLLVPTLRFVDITVLLLATAVVKLAVLEVSALINVLLLVASLVPVDKLAVATVSLLVIADVFVEISVACDPFWLVPVDSATEILVLLLANPAVLPEMSAA